MSLPHRPVHGLVAVIPGLAVALLSAGAFGAGIEFVVPKEEPDTQYTKRWNWSHPRCPYYAGTRYADESGGCGPRLDSSRNPDGTYLGTATATFTGLPTGKYELWVYYRKSKNRTSTVPWTITANGTGNNRMTGTVNQNAPLGCCGDWYLIAETRKNPLDVIDSLTLVWHSDSARFPGYEKRSVSYGGAKVIQVDGAGAGSSAGGGSTSGGGTTTGGDNGGGTAGSDNTSDGSGGLITLWSPTGGETLAEGSTVDIVWTSTGEISAVSIEISTDGGATWETLVASTENDGSYAWQISQQPSDGYMIRVVDPGNPTVYGASLGSFEIGDPIAGSQQTAQTAAGGGGGSCGAVPIVPGRGDIPPAGAALGWLVTLLSLAGVYAWRRRACRSVGMDSRGALR